MAYDPTVWKSGDTITSAKLNKLENGLAEASGGGTGGGVLVVRVVESVADKTWQEIKTASASQIVIIVNDTSVAYMCEILEPMPPIVEKYQVSFALFTDNGDGTGSVSVDTLKCDTANDYPSYL